METSNTLTVSCVQLHWAKDIDYNMEKAVHYMKQAKKEGSDLVVFPESNITSYYFPYAVELDQEKITKSIKQIQDLANDLNIWTIIGSIQKTPDRYLNLAHVINDSGYIVHEYAKVHKAGDDEKKYCRGGEKLSFFEIKGIPCTMVICRDGRHPELYRLPAMAGAKIVFQPSCSSDEIEAVAWKRTSGRAQYPKGPNSKIFHCVANTIGQSPDGKQTTSGASFIREPSGIPLAEAGNYQEEMITAVMDIDRATRSYIKDSFSEPQFLRKYWEEMIKEVEQRKDIPPR